MNLIQILCTFRLRVSERVLKFGVRRVVSMASGGASILAPDNEELGLVVG